ncbi:MAG: FtsW/RodA/SpoVE family cell cycle protein [Patescibacteria group bacterium]
MYRTFLQKLRSFDWILLGSVLMLSAIGLIMIYGISTSLDYSSTLQFRKQLIALIIGLAFMVALALWNYRQLRNYGMVVYFIGALLLIAVLFFGAEIRGTQGWFKLGNITIQPVEVAKVCFAVFMASYFSKQIHKYINWITFFGSFTAMSVYVFLILLQPDFGSAMIILVMWLIAVAFAGLRLRSWIALLAVGGLAVILAWTFLLAPYQKSRITSFLNPGADPLGAGYNVIQAQTALGSGGWLGKGIGKGSQSRLRFLPEASTDFMFAVMGEELGFAGIALILGLFGVVLFRIIYIGYKSGDVFVEIYCILIAGMFGMHVLINAGMNMGIMPVTGIPLPFASAAASSLAAGFIALGIVQSTVMHADALDRLA